MLIAEGGHAGQNQSDPALNEYLMIDTYEAEEANVLSLLTSAPRRPECPAN